MVQNSRRSHRVAGEARWNKRSGVQAINEKSGRALALPRRLTLEADCLYGTLMFYAATNTRFDSVQRIKLNM